jgi:hypothetical protein
MLLYHWRRSQVRRAKCMSLRPKHRPSLTLGIYIRSWKVFCKILSAGKRTFFPRELDKAGSIYIWQNGYSLSGAKECLFNYCSSSILGHTIGGSGLRREMPNIWRNKEVFKLNFQYWLSTQKLLKMG